MPAHPRVLPSKEGYKVCPKCGEEKPLTAEFWHRSKERKGGFHGWCRPCTRAIQIAHISKPENRAKKNEASARRQRKERLAALEHYSGGIPVCSCPGCGVTELEFLAFDHINGGGVHHRRTVYKANLPHWLLKNNFPEGFRVLCHNCNQSRGAYGYCPHETRVGEFPSLDKKNVTVYSGDR